MLKTMAGPLPPAPWGTRALDCPLCTRSTSGERQGTHARPTGDISLWFCCYRECFRPGQSFCPSRPGWMGEDWQLRLSTPRPTTTTTTDTKMHRFLSCG